MGWLTQRDDVHAAGVDDVVDAAVRLREAVETVIYGKPEVVELALTCLLAEGHLLVEDVPGVGKTELAKALARSIGGRFTRIQGTPDLLPSDVTGSYVYDRTTGALSFRHGPVFADVVLADELNRAAPKTQSALLQVMQERAVTVEDSTHAVDRPFIVIATMNPTGHVGIYDLPEAQIDRFMMSVPMGYPDRRSEALLVDGRHHGDDTPAVEPVLRPSRLLELVAVARRTHLSPALVDYIVAIADATRRHPDVDRGVSPRATIALASAVRTRAAMQGRDHGVPDDVRVLAPPVLAHRLVLSSEVTMQGRSAREVLATVLRSVPVPARRHTNAFAARP